MVMINLLPWREGARLYHNKVIKKMLLAAIFLALSMLSGVHWVLSCKEKQIDDHVMRLRSELKRYELQKKAEVRPTFIKELRHVQSLTNKVFLELGKVQSTGVCFTKISRLKNTIAFSGQASSAAELTDYLSNWNAAYLFSEIKIVQLEQQENQPIKFLFHAVNEGFVKEDLSEGAI